MDLIEQIKRFFAKQNILGKNEFLARLPQLKNVKELGKGLANINFLLNFGDLKFVMRFNIWPDQVWNNGNQIDVENEYRILKFLESYEIGPKAYFVDTSKTHFPSSFLIEEYIEHDSKSVSEDFTGVVNTVKRLHAANIEMEERFFRTDADADGKIKLYDNWLKIILQNNQSEIASLFSKYADIYKRYLKDNADLLIGNNLIHRDLFPENFLHKGNRWFMVDWQTAVIGNPIQDITYLLWDFIYQYTLKRQLTDEEKRSIITAYFGGQVNIQDILSKVNKLLPIFYIDLFIWLLYKAESFKKQTFPEDLKEFLWNRIKGANDIVLKEDQIELWFSKMK